MVSKNISSLDSEISLVTDYACKSKIYKKKMQVNLYPLGMSKIIAAPSRQRVAPTISHLSGIDFSTSHDHPKEQQIYIPPYIA